MNSKGAGDDAQQLIHDPVYQSTTSEINPIEDEIQAGKYKNKYFISINAIKYMSV